MKGPEERLRGGKFSGGGKRYVAQGCHAEWDEDGWIRDRNFSLLVGVVSERPGQKSKIQFQNLWFDGAKLFPEKWLELNVQGRRVVCRPVSKHCGQEMQEEDYLLNDVLVIILPGILAWNRCMLGGPTVRLVIIQHIISLSKQVNVKCKRRCK
jgi:hypothetical protein